MAEPITFNWLQIDLSEGRHVFVAERNDEFYIQLKNAEGKLTRFRLSRDATEALGQLIGAKTGGLQLMTYIINAASETLAKREPTYEWRETSALSADK